MRRHGRCPAAGAFAFATYFRVTGPPEPVFWCWPREWTKRSMNRQLTIYVNVGSVLSRLASVSRLLASIRITAAKSRKPNLMFASPWPAISRKRWLQTGAALLLRSVEAPQPNEVSDVRQKPSGVGEIRLT
jgi:hypothetical protein